MATDRYAPFWNRNGVGAVMLGPVEWLFRRAVTRRRARAATVAQWIDAPVVVVGNISVGGTGKTPLVHWLVETAAGMGFSPGIILRGHRGRVRGVMPVSADGDPRLVGDEAVLLARRTGRPVVIGADRPAAGRTLLNTAAVDLVISDDGLQHYALGRDVEIAVIDAGRVHGNGRCLPAGPLREPMDRLEEVDLVLGNGQWINGCGGMFEIVPEPLRALPGTEKAGAPPTPGCAVHAVAGIGNPERFFATLKAMGFLVHAHPLGDHHAFRPDDLRFEDDAPVIVTEKDAVKCRGMAPTNSWYLPVAARPDTETAVRLGELLGLARRRFLNRGTGS
ncbi:tetraacyldisaccharide 4'-kinase [Spiribacter sp. 221]|uniref:tetraacyldisaccharide 4'-kinase n=1 Tax=Spiribacter onubensis TaxID=3122420 RepID=UPI00349F4688